ncbi:hypothetical protein MNEG_5035 [Monoraphidium neglectum]|uniref:Uncharacterized protein n=1 Tax=Monoraphidium neglectum TaxID=145388 RepID=A0A0D2NBT1_9CHLO|nr:hypothetical protein MNEG_5035 [Monoraphidium neglectum]KIZ02926.1 hypothetical protein MNEG_5035 [Monoraphidium neglectum]|eukprot:XP_013901945.1 hypothetical protein MNEG_5035 [Monoraphidium neglectum]
MALARSGALLVAALLVAWARQALCAAATTAGGCQAVDSSSRCFWDAKKSVCFTNIKSSEALACPNSWVADFMSCDVLDKQDDCEGAAQCTWGNLGTELLCFAKVALDVKPPFPDWGSYQRVTFTDPGKLGNCPAANEYRKFQSQCWSLKEPDVCEKNKVCLYNPIAGCNIRARANAAIITGNNPKVDAAYAACNAILDPKLCDAAGKVEFSVDAAKAIAGV